MKIGCRVCLEVVSDNGVEVKPSTNIGVCDDCGSIIDGLAYLEKCPAGPTHALSELGLIRKTDVEAIAPIVLEAATKLFAGFDKMKSPVGE